MDADGTDKPKKSMKPRQGVIDLEATEIERESGPDPAPDESDATEPSVSERFAPLIADLRSQLGVLIAAGVAGAVIAMLCFILLLSLELIPIGGGDAAIANRVAGLEEQVQNLIEAPQSRPQPVYDDGALRREIADVKREVEILRSGTESSSGDSALAERVSQLETRVAQAVNDRASASAVSQLAARVDDLAAKATEARAPDPSVQEALDGAKATAALAAVASLESAVARGQPYAGALGVVRAQLPDADITALETGADKGLQPAALQAERLAGALEHAPAPPSTATGFLDRLAEGARGLVRVRPVDGSVPAASAEDPWSVRNAVAVRLGQSDYAGALADWDKLDAPAKEATKDEAEALRSRLAADSALDALRAAALGETAEKTP